MAAGRDMLFSLANKYGWKPPEGVTPAAAQAMDNLMVSWGQPLNIISAYRDPKRNAAVGGASKSQHMHGNAFDVDVSDLPQEQRIALIQQARQQGFKGVGVYDNSLHFDVAGDRAWGPNYRRNSLPDWAAEAVSAPIGGVASGAGQTAGTFVPQGPAAYGAGQTIAEPPLPPSLLDMPARSDSPVTIADAELAQEGNKFHPGLGLQSLGAAIAAGSQGLSVADALGDIRKQYFAEQDAAYAKQKEEMARQSAVQILGGPDSALGRAVLEGMPLDQAMQIYAQERGFQQQSAMAERGFYNDRVMQEDQQRYGAAAQERGFEQEFNMEGVRQKHRLTNAEIEQQFALGRIDLEQRNAMIRQNDAQLHDLTTMRHEQDFTTSERLASEGFTAEQSAANRAASKEEWSARLDETRRQFNTELATTMNSGAAGREAVARAQEAAGDAAGAVKTRQMATTSFSDPSMVNSILDGLKAAAPSDAAAKVAEFIEIATVADQLEATNPALAEGMRKKFLSGSGVTVNMDTSMKPFISADADVIKEKYTGRLSDYSNVEGALNTIEYELLSNPNARTGPIAALLLTPLSVAADTGLFGEDAQKNMGTLNAIDRANFLLASASKLPGAVSNYEQVAYKQANIGVATQNDRILQDVQLAKTSIARSRAQAEYIANRVIGSAQGPEGTKYVNVATAEKEWAEKVKRGDPDTVPLIKDIDNFTRENIKAVGIKMGDVVRAGGNTYKIDTPEELAEINSILGL